MLSDLRESGAVEQDADAVLLIYRAEYYYAAGTTISLGDKEFETVEAGKGEVQIAKNRGGQTGVAYFAYNREFNKLVTYYDGQYTPDLADFSEPRHARVESMCDDTPF